MFTNTQKVSLKCVSKNAKMCIDRYTTMYVKMHIKMYIENAFENIY